MYYSLEVSQIKTSLLHMHVEHKFTKILTHALYIKFNFSLDMLKLIEI